MSSTDVVAYHVENRIAWLKFNRPDKPNAMNPPLNRAMLKALEGLEFRDDVGELVLTGEGSSWSAGMDLKEYFRETASQGLKGTRKAQSEAYAWWRKLRWYQKPTIAMVNGWCFGGGYGPLYACDLAIAAEEATFGLSEINWGILPGGGATKVATNSMSFRDAMYHTLTGENISGKKAAEWKLVNEAVPLAKLKERVTALANILLQKNPAALRACKQAAKRVGDMSWDDAEDYLFAKLDQMRFLDPEQGRERAMRQFLDEKTYRPGLGNYKRDA